MHHESLSMKKYDVIIVGAGPAGIFSALELVNKKKSAKVLIVEKGRGYRSEKMPNDDKRCILQGMP